MTLQVRDIMPSDASQIGMKCACAAFSTAELSTLDEPQSYTDYTPSPPGPCGPCRIMEMAPPLASTIGGTL